MTGVGAVGEQTSLADRKRRAGQRLFLGFEGTTAHADLRYLVRHIQPAGFVLFTRNVVHPHQVHELNRELCGLVDGHAPAIIAIDQEGGRVQRVRDPATVWPTMRQVASHGDLTAEVSRALSRELRAMGFHLNFAPVADVDSNPDNPIIGDRSFGPDPQTVARHVVDFITAAQQERIAACAKHFPGHGDTHLDSHVALPTVERTLTGLHTTELPPFAAAIHANVASIMTAHVVFPALDPERPATLSDQVIPRLLRDELGFSGVVFSDDMEMKAVHGRWSLEDQVVLASRATVDVLLCCRDAELQMDMFQALIHTQETDPGMDRACRDSHQRLDLFRRQFVAHKDPAPPLDIVGSDTHCQLASRAAHGHG